MVGGYFDITGFLPPVDLDTNREPIPLVWPPSEPLQVVLAPDGVRLADGNSYDRWLAIRAQGDQALATHHVSVVSGARDEQLHGNAEPENDPQVIEPTCMELPGTEPQAIESTQPKKPTKPKPQKIKIALIRTDGGTQLRVGGLDEDVVTDYTEALKRKDKLPPVNLVYDGEVNWLVGGFHRLEAHVRAGREVIEAVVTPGELRDAVLLAVSENATHGLRRTNQDKRRAAEVILQDPEWSIWGDREIARLCGIGYTLVGTVRRELSARGGQIEMDNSLSQSSSPPADSAETRLARRGESVYLTRVGGRGNAVVEGEVPEDIEVEDSQEDCNVDAVVVAEGAHTPVTEPQERESESSVSPNKAEAGGTEDAVSVDGAVDAAIAEPPQVELVIPVGGSDKGEDEDTEDDGEEEDTEDEEPDQEGEVGATVHLKDAPKKSIDPVDAWAVVLATVRQRPDLVLNCISSRLYF